ncbi:MAG TPA: efflux RND transporter periplasmic adaptor subunit [Terriglobales bacterium]|nr:efflux RND transporter periplasmic adaptor subunit [Terriglobales bacterium]
MNITEALNAALPDIPARMISERYPRVAPDIVFREHIEDGKPVFRVYVPSAEAMYKFPPQNWALIQLFDGQRSYEDIAELYSRQTKSEYSSEQVRDFAAELESMEFWYKTPQEKNVVLMQKTAEERRKLLQKKSKFGDLSLILFPAVNPDKFLTWLYRYTSFFYTQWFTLLTLVAFGFAAGITITHWSEIGRDTLEFYNFADKSWGDVVQFYLLALVVLGIHELGHGHACKHYGGRVPAMGFALIYLAPAFYTDTTEGDVKGTRYERLIIALAGVWAELMIYAVATPIWWGTPPDTAVHNAAYILMLITGISAALINWNPLIKLDGYHMLCEILGIVDLKEASTAFVSAWVKRHIWGLPVDVPYVPRSRRFGYAVYALLSGFYSYTVLYVVARFVGNVFRNFNPDWSFIPELATAGLIFRSRIRTLLNFMKFVYLDKKDRIRAWFRPTRTLALGAVTVVVMLLPLWRESAFGHFVLEPAQRAVLRNRVPGVVTDVYADEGQTIVAGAPVVQLRNLPLQSKLARSQADLVVASGRATSAVMHYGEFGAAMQERDRLAQQTHQLGSEAANLQLTSPIAGIVVTPRVRDRIGSYAQAGTELAEVADLRNLRARIYVPEHEIYKFRVGSPAKLQVEGIVKKWNSSVVGIAPLSSAIPAGLEDVGQYKGIRAPNFFTVDLMIANDDGRLRPGMLGIARVYGQRRSLGGFAAKEIANFLGRKIW